MDWSHQGYRTDRGHGIGGKKTNVSDTFLIGLAPADQNGSVPVFHDTDVFHVDSNDLRPPSECVIGQVHERDVSEVNRVVATSGYHAVDNVAVECGGLLLAGSTGPVHAFDCKADGLGLSGRRQAGGGVEFGQGGDVAADGGAFLSSQIDGELLTQGGVLQSQRCLRHQGGPREGE